MNFIEVNKKRFERFIRGKDYLWIGIVSMILCISSIAYAAEPIAISHTVIDYTSDGPTTTLNLSLGITNNGNDTLADAVISAAPLGPLADRLFKPAPEESPVVISNIPVSGNTSITYSIKFTSILPEEINSHPLFWEIKYTDATGQAQMILAASHPAASL